MSCTYPAKMYLRSIWLAFVLVLVVFAQRGLADCGAPPRNIKYSDNFYKAQAWYMQHSHAFSAAGSVLVNGVPLGGSVCDKDWSQEASSLSEAEARGFVEQELHNHKAQIVAEAGYAICELSQGGLRSLRCRRLTQSGK